MKLYTQVEGVDVIGVKVKTFPNGIKEAFGALMKALGSNRDYYGISWMDENDKIIYYAVARELSPNEGKQYNYEYFKINKGQYRSEAIHDWMSKTECIKDVLHNLMGNEKPDKNHPCIEWYKSDDEMLCMIEAL